MTGLLGHTCGRRSPARSSRRWRITTSRPRTLSASWPALPVARGCTGLGSRIAVDRWIREGTQCLSQTDCRLATRSCTPGSSRRAMQSCRPILRGSGLPAAGGPDHEPPLHAPRPLSQRRRIGPARDLGQVAHRRTVIRCTSGPAKHPGEQRERPAWLNAREATRQTNSSSSVHACGGASPAPACAYATSSRQDTGQPAERSPRQGIEVSASPPSHPRTTDQLMKKWMACAHSPPDPRGRRHGQTGTVWVQL